MPMKSRIHLNMNNNVLMLHNEILSLCALSVILNRFHFNGQL